VEELTWRRKEWRRDAERASLLRCCLGEEARLGEGRGCSLHRCLGGRGALERVEGGLGGTMEETRRLGRERARGLASWET